MGYERYFFHIWSLKLGYAVFAIREMPFLFNLVDVLIALAAEEQLVLLQIIDKLFRLSIKVEDRENPFGCIFLFGKCACVDAFFLDEMINGATRIVKIEL